MNKILNVAYHCSDMFAPILGASLVSLLENNKGMEEINIYIFENPFSDENRNKLNGLATQYGRRIFYIPMPDVNKEQRLGLKSVKKIWFFNSYVRLFLSDYLPASVDKVLYLDSDVLVVSDLTDLINTDMGDKCAAGVIDVFSEDYYALFGLDRNAHYCNSGVILENLTLWRKRNIGDKIRKYVKDNGGFVYYMEQTTFNAVFQNQIFILPPKYNSYSLFHLLTYQDIIKVRNPFNYYNEEQVLEAAKSPSIIHLTTSFLTNNRAWYENSNHPKASLYQDYKALSPWKDAPDFRDDRNRWKRIIDYYVHKLPKSLVLPVAEYLYNRYRIRKIGSLIAQSKKE